MIHTRSHSQPMINISSDRALEPYGLRPHVATDVNVYTRARTGEHMELCGCVKSTSGVVTDTNTYTNYKSVIHTAQ